MGLIEQTSGTIEKTLESLKHLENEIDQLITRDESLRDLNLGKGILTNKNRHTLNHLWTDILNAMDILEFDNEELTTGESRYNKRKNTEYTKREN